MRSRRTPVAKKTKPKKTEPNKDLEERWARASRCALNKLTQADAEAMLFEIEQTAGIHSVLSLSGQDVLESMDGTYEFNGPPEKLKEYADHAAEHVAGLDWSNEYGSAKELAENKVKELVEAGGYELKDL
jgi:hypothetical protein